MQASPFFLRTLTATGRLSLLLLLGLAQSTPQSGLARPATAPPLPAAPGQTTPGQSKAGSPVPLPTAPAGPTQFGQPGPAQVGPGGTKGTAPGAGAAGASAAGGGASFGQYPVALGALPGTTAALLPADPVRLTLDEAQGRFPASQLPAAGPALQRGRGQRGYPAFSTGPRPSWTWQRTTRVAKRLTRKNTLIADPGALHPLPGAYYLRGHA